jgi:hypothetical protein
VILERPDSRDICPGWRWWQRYQGEDWLVFIDESFRGFFELAPTGYFGHAAVGVPAREYPRLQELVAPVVQDFVASTGEEARELKHNLWKRLDYRVRRKLALRLRGALEGCGGFVAGFYTTVRAAVLEDVRTNLLGRAEALPEDDESLCAEAMADLRAEPKGPGESKAIKRLLSLPCLSVAHFLGSFGGSFRIVCDPREKREDRVVHASVAQVISMMRNIREALSDAPADLHKLFRGIDRGRPSEDDVGLQIADIVVGEVCAFFAANPEMMSFGASRQLVTQATAEPRTALARTPLGLAKTGILKKLHPGLAKRFSRPDPKQRTVLPLFSRLFATGILTCYSTTGQPRDICGFERVIWDQTDA